MTGRKAAIGSAIIVALSLATSALALADDCKLSRIAALDVSIDHGGMFVPVSIEGNPTRMLVETGGITAIDPQTANDYHIPTHRIARGYYYDSAGQPVTYVAEIHSMTLGQLQANNFSAIVWPSPMFGERQSAGAFGVDFLRNYDVDIDIANHKLSLFAQDHCPGKVVYWQADSVAVIPMHVVNSGHIVLPVILDGHQFDAVFDTGASGSLLSLEAAQNAFGLKVDTPDLEPVGEVRGALTVPVYKHAFRTLQFGGISIDSPTVYIRENLMKYSTTQAPHIGTRISSANQLDGVTDMTIGLYEMRNLHVYIAYKEQKLYISASSPIAPPVASAAAAVSPQTAATH